MRIAGFEIYFDDLESAKRFYRDTLGLQMTGEQPGHHAQFGASPFLCLESRGAESYPSPEGHNVLLIQSSGGREGGRS